MTEMLQRAYELASRLSEAEQDALAAHITFPELVLFDQSTT